MLNQKTEFAVTIESVAFGGKGVGHRDGKVVFVPGTLPGDRVKVSVKKEKKNHTSATLLKILEPSPIRQAPEPGFVLPRTTVPYSDGYCYYYTDYANELILKQEQFTTLFSQYESLQPGAILEPVAAPSSRLYRNKIKLNIEDDHGVIKLGYVMANNATVLNLPGCPLAMPQLNTLLADLNSQTNFRHTLRQGMTVTLRYTEHDGALFWRNKPKKNATWLQEETVLGTLSVPQGSFFQVNTPVCNILLEKIGAYLDTIAPDVALDFYCGIGIFSIAAAQQGIGLTVGIDLDPTAIQAATYNAKRHNLTNCQFLAGDAGKNAQDILDTHPDAKSCLIIDPPRTGMDHRCRSIIRDSGISDILYISCSSDTLVRDAGFLAKGGYQIVETQLLDMFPRTAHFESLTHLKKV